MKKLLPFLLLLTACSSSQQATQAVTPDECGVERWHVKNILDADSSSIVQLSQFVTIAHIDSMSRVSVNATTPRLAFEKQIVTLTCTVTEMKREDDGDVHLLLEDSLGNTMIAEVPDPAQCTEVSHSRWSSQYTAVQNYIRSNFGNPTTAFKPVGQRVMISGPLFQDFQHGQKNEAPNSVEIHPVLAIQ